MLKFSCVTHTGVHLPSNKLVFSADKPCCTGVYIACACYVCVWLASLPLCVLPDSGGCARKRAAMSVTLTAVKRAQSSPNLLTSGIETNQATWRVIKN